MCSSYCQYIINKEDVRNIPKPYMVIDSHHKTYKQKICQLSYYTPLLKGLKVPLPPPQTNAKNP